MYRSLLLLTLSLLIALSSCRDTAGDGSDEDFIGFEMTINGIKWEAEQTEAVLFLDTACNQVAKKMNVKGTARDGSQVLLVIIDTFVVFDFAGSILDTCVRHEVDYAVGVDSIACDFTSLTYIENGVQPFDFGEVGFVDVTTCDEITKLVSGDFSYQTQNPDTGIEYNFEDGKFFNVPYLVID